MLQQFLPNTRPRGNRPDRTWGQAGQKWIRSAVESLVAYRCMVVRCLVGMVAAMDPFPVCRIRTTAMPSHKKRPVALNVQDREDLERITTTGGHGASEIMRTRVLLALDTSIGTVNPVVVIAAKLCVSCGTLRLVAKRFADAGGDAHATIARKRRPGPPVPLPVIGGLRPG